MKYTHEELNKRCEKYYEELLKKGIDMDEIQDLCVIFLESGGDKRPRKKYLENKMSKEEFERDLVPFVEHNQELVYSIDPTIDFRILQENIFKSLSTLTKREICVMYLVFAEERSLEKAGEYFNITRERTRQILAKALRKMRHPSRSRNLKDYIYCNINAASEHLKDHMCLDDIDALGKAYEYVENGGLPIFDYHKRPKISDVKIVFADNGINIENVFYPCFDPCKFSEAWDKFRATLTGRRIFHKNVYDTMMDQRKIMIDEIERIIYYSVERDKKSRSVNVKTMRNTSGIFNYIKYNILDPAKNNNSDPLSVNKILSSLLNFMDDIKRNNIVIIDQCQTLLEKFPKHGVKIVSLYDLNFSWALENYTLLPPALSKYIRMIDKFRRNRSIKTVINPGIFDSLSFIEILKEYEKILKTDEVSKCISKIDEFAKTNSNDKCNFIPVIITNKSYIAKKSLLDDKEWKKDLLIVKQISDQKSKQKTRARYKQVTKHYPQLKYIGNTTNRYKRIEDCIISRINDGKPSVETFVNKLLFIYKIDFRYKDFYFSDNRCNLYTEYCNFIRGNIEWIKFFIRNMISKGVIDINNHEIDLNISCNDLDVNMVDNAIIKVLTDIGCPTIHECYAESAYYLYNGLDHHYITLLDLLFILVNKFNYKTKHI